MAIPDYETLMLPLLRLVAESKLSDVALSDAISRLADEFKLTDDERSEWLPSGSSLKFNSRVSWARTYLQKAKVLESRQRGHTRLTERGKSLLAENPPRVDGKLLMRFPEFVEFVGKKNSKSEKLPATEDTPSSLTPREAIESHAAELRKTLAEDLLDKIKNSTPEFFERLVIRLLVKMGYGGSLQDAGEAIGKSGDGGIDGVIREDKLGLDNIYIQAKRWSDRSVGGPDIDQFAGALSKKKAHKGIFITTSSFTKAALDSVKEYTSKIILIDGVTLAEYMIDYDVGVATATTIQIKKLDVDFFDDGDTE